MDTWLVPAAPPPSSTGWPVTAVAARVGVSVSTLHSWERRYGVAPQARTSGGHRRYSAADVAQLQRMRRLIAAGMSASAAAASLRTRHRPAAAPPAAEAAGAHRDPAAARLHQAAIGLDARRSARLAHQVVQERGCVRAWTEVFSPVLQSLGRHWQQTGMGVECEHLVVPTIQSALDRHTSRPRPAATRGAVLIAACPGEAHTLPMHALAAALAEQDHRSDIFGDLPEDALLAAIEQRPPAAIVLWTRTRALAERTLLRRIRTAAPVVCAAGIGWSARLPAPVVGARGLEDAVEVLRAALA